MNYLPISKNNFNLLFKDKEILKFTTSKNKYYLEYYYKNYINEKGFFYTDSYKINPTFGYRDFDYDEGREYTASIKFTKKSVPIYENINSVGYNLTIDNVKSEVYENLNNFFYNEIDSLIYFSKIEFLEDKNFDQFIFDNIILEFNKMDTTFIKLYKTIGKKRYRKYTSGNNSQTLKIFKSTKKVDIDFYKKYKSDFINKIVYLF
jgi:hypothetical protein